MTLYAKIKAERLSARKQGRVLEAGLYGTLIGEIERREPTIVNGDKGYPDDVVVAVVRKMISGLRELEKVGKAVADEVAALEIFMPQMMDESALREAAKNCNSMPEFMKWLKANRPGQYDGRYASAIAGEIFAPAS